MSTILLVEDNPHIMKINAEALTMYGYEILQAATARECRQALRWHPVDLVVLDIMLPDGDGVELCRELKEQYHVPILFLSALGESRDVVEGLRAGGDDYLAKPYDLGVLAARIEAMGAKATACASVQDGVDRAIQAEGPHGVACALGSLYMSGEVRSCFGKN